ncbi:armadillo-type protein [Mycena capillaripes]|nr:armadillo-type protein [Mycena capillaripes]
MPPLARQQTHTSIHSWWSNSNPGLQGPTINLHSVAKPLMRFMYHQQAVKFIKANGGSLLSREVVDIFSAYLSYKYVSPSTKIAVLQELFKNTFEQGYACAVAESGIFSCLLELVGFPNAKVRKHTCLLVGQLVAHESTALTTRQLELCEQMVSLLHDEDIGVTAAAAFALSYFSRLREGAKVIVDVKGLDRLADLLGSPSAWARRNVCYVVAELASHNSIAPAVCKLHLCERMVSLLHDESVDVIAGAMFALSTVAYHPEGAQEVVDVKGLDYIADLLGSSSALVRENAGRIVVNLASHNSTAPAVCKSKLCGKLVPLLHDENVNIVVVAVTALSQVAYYPEGAQDVVDVKGLDYIVELFGSPSAKVRRYICWLVGRLARHESIVSTLLVSLAWEQLLNLSHDDDERVRNQVELVLRRMREAPDSNISQATTSTPDGLD